MSRSRNSRRGSRGTHRCDCERCLQIDRKEGVEAHDVDQAHRALLDYELSPACPDGCRPHMPDIEALDALNDEVVGPCNVVRHKAPELPAPASLRVPIAWSIESHLGALQDRVHQASGKLIKATPLRLPRSRA